MPAPLIFIGLPLILAPVLFWLKRQPSVQTALGAGACGLLALLALRLPLERPVAWLGGRVIADTFAVLGRPFTIQPIDRLGLAFIFAQAALLFVAARLSGSRRAYTPIGMAILALLAAALFIQPFVFAALFLELAAALCVTLLADERHRTTRGALRFLVFMTIGMILILVTGWLLEAIAASPDDTRAIVRATVMLGAGFAVLLGVTPFHNWVPVVADHSPPLAAAFVFTVIRYPMVFLLLDFLQNFAWLNQNPAVYRALTVAGGAMTLVGALFVLGQRSFGRTLGYAMLIDTGALLLALGLGTREGIEAAVALLALRGLALFLWGMGLEHLRDAAQGDSFALLRGAGRRHPLASVGVVAGLLSLVGFPVTAGFPARWALLHLLAQIHPTAALLLLVGLASVGLACARGLAALLTPSAQPGQPAWHNLPRPAFGVYGVGFAVLLLLGAFPQALLPLLAAALQTFLGPAPVASP